MRAAKFTQSKHKTLGNVYNYPVKGDNYVQYEVDCTFHQFAQEGENGEIWPVAIVELNDGTVHSIAIHAIKFTSKLTR